MRIGSLFSGIGGLELGLERAGLGHTVWQCEIDERCRRVLARHWPDALRYDDVRSLDARALPPIDLLCGGFPCQDLSSAGRGAGLRGPKSGLWFEFLRLIRELRPRWVVIENVASGALKWADPVRGALGRAGYASLPIPLSASDLGAPHCRARVFLAAWHTAHAARLSELRAPQLSLADTEGPSKPPAHVPWREVGWTGRVPEFRRVAHGVSRRLDGISDGARRTMLGNAVVPQCAEVVGLVVRELDAQLFGGAP